MPLHPFLVKTKGYKPIQGLLKKSQKYWAYVQFMDFIRRTKSKGLINDYYRASASYKDRFQLHEQLVTYVGNEAITYLEFGVAAGDMIRYWVTHQSNKNSQFIGFDSFEGLPESWENKEKGHFNQSGATPDIYDDRVRFVKGWFQDSVYDAIQGIDFSNRSVFHLDADIFSSTLYVLFHLHPKMKPGDILIFDEYSSFEHEFSAFELFKQCAARDWEYEFLGAINNYRQVAFEIKK